ncbi:MAG: hypothetical protein Q9191_001870 [Dirinaria sp. TL-2023a]
MGDVEMFTGARVSDKAMAASRTTYSGAASSLEGQDWLGAYEDEEVQDGLQSSSPELDLPISPLIDPKLIAARERHRTPKPAPGENVSEFSQKLRNNPYALAMATPVRTCSLTGFRLPAYFHLRFGLQTHPVTGAPWHLPRMAANKVLKPSKKRQALEDKNPPPTTSADHEEPSDPQTHRQPAVSGPKSVRTLSGSYLPARATALRYVSKLKRKYYIRIIPNLWKEGTTIKTDNIVWREDMESYVLALMRTEVIHHLSYLSSLPSGYIVRCDDWDRIDQHHQVGAILWLGDLEPPRRKEDSLLGAGGSADTADDDERQPRASEKDQGPPPYAMVYYRRHHIPVYNAPVLLGNDRLHSLCKDTVALRGNLAIIKRKHNTVDLQMALWKLMGYLAPDD